LPRQCRWRGRGRRHPRRPHRPCHPARALHRRRRDLDPRRPRLKGAGGPMKAPPAPAIAVAALDHVVLRVADLERATTFYRDVLNCPVEKWQPEIGLLQLRAGAALIDLVTLDG